MLRYRGNLKNNRMMMCGSEKWFRIAGLLARQRVGQLSEKELRELEEWREVSSENKLLYDRWQDG